MKQIRLLLLAVVLSIVFGCANKTESSILVPTVSSGKIVQSQLKSAIAISGEAKKETYLNFVTGGSQSAYQITITIENISSNPLSFSEARFRFNAGNSGKGLSVTVKKGSGEIGIMETIAPGEKKEYNLTTDGYTRDLLADAEGKPISLSLIFYKNGQPNSGKYVAVLPELGKLPVYETNPNEKGVLLVFTLTQM